MRKGYKERVNDRAKLALSVATATIYRKFKAWRAAAISAIMAFLCVVGILLWRIFNG